MAARRLLDVAKLVQAARSVAKQHVVLRSEQLERYNKSSTLAKQAKAQSDRIVLTLQAAAALARRLNEDENSDQYANTTASTRAEEHPAAETATSDEKSSRARHENSPQPVWLNEEAPAIDQNAKGEPRNSVEDFKRRRLNHNSSDGQVLPNKPKNHVKMRDEIAKGIDPNVFRTKRVSQVLGSQNDAEETKNTTSDESLANSRASSTLATGMKVEQLSTDHIIQQGSSELRQSRVPATRIGRLWQYGGLATSMALGALGESLRRATGSSSEGSLILNPSNMEKLVARLSRMRGAALKLGQMLSFQG
jgi:aarF domain-containing kinase